MLVSLSHTLELLSSSHAPQLILGLIACGVVLLTCADEAISILAFLVQRLITLTLLWPAIAPSWAITNVVAFVAVALVWGSSALSWQRKRLSQDTDSDSGRRLLLNTPFRLLATVLAILVSYGVTQIYASQRTPYAIAFTTIWIIVISLLTLLFSRDSLGVGLGVLTCADGCRVWYALSQPQLLVWGLWSICDILVALGAVYLRNAEISANSTTSEKLP